jgi:hypothetical protein
MTDPVVLTGGIPALAASGTRIEAALMSSRLGAKAVADATAIRMVAAGTLSPAPRDPLEHLRAAHAMARGPLTRLADHDPAVEVTSTMTSSLFVRLTRKPADPPRPPTPTRHYTYTPRKILRRVLDHALDHLNQIDQWLAWLHDGIAPTPTDGWASSVVTLPEDRLPLGAADLDAWLWRIDQAARLIDQRAGGLDTSELDWPPPDGGWPLRRVLHHVARTEAAYAGALERALPTDAAARYLEATRRLTESLRKADARGSDDSVIYVNGYGAVYTPDQVVDEVLSVELDILSAAA